MLKTILLLAALLLPISGLAQSQNEADLFARPAVHRIQIQLSESALDALRKSPKDYTQATVREGDKVYTDVGVRFKSDGKLQSVDQKPSLVLKFDEFVKKQQFHNLKRIQLNNSKSDPSYLSEALSGEVFRAAGLPAAKVTFARVEMNGRDLGLYQIVEAANKDFLSQYFKNADGNLYEGSNQDVVDKLEQDGGDESANQADLKALAAAAREPDPAERWKKLAQVLDVDRFIKFVAAEVLVAHHDGYSRDRNNYRLYHDPTSGKFVFIPHGLDETFKTDEPVIQNWEGVVAIGVLSTPAGRQQYLAQVSQLRTTAFKVDTLQARINALAAIIRPAITEHDPAVASAFESEIVKLRAYVSRRSTFLEQQLK
jgi:spore coat protein H